MWTRAEGFRSGALLALVGLALSCGGEGSSDAGLRDAGADVAILCVDDCHPCCAFPVECDALGRPRELQACGDPFDCTPETVQLPTVENGCAYHAPLTRAGVATHLGFAELPSGALFVSGYDSGLRTFTHFGDLLLGEVRPAGSGSPALSWRILEGVPQAPVVPLSGVTPLVSGWRGGVAARGDDVGAWSAMAAIGDGLALVYYDRTAGALRYGSTRDAGLAWSSHTVDDAGDAGRYPGLAFMLDGRPVIASWTAVARTQPGVPEASLRVATANGPTTSSADWSVIDLLPTPSPLPCDAALCGPGLVCLASGECVADPGGAPRFVDDGHQAALVRNVTQVRPTASGVALVWFDAGRGSLFGSAFDAVNGTWRAAFAIDGLDASAGVGAGAGASLLVDAQGDWHISYVTLGVATLRYARVDGATLGNVNPDIVIEVVDDGGSGARVPAVPTQLGRHASGEVSVACRDAATVGVLLARRALGGAWNVMLLADDAELGLAGRAVLDLAFHVQGEDSYLVTYGEEPAGELGARLVRF
ncbi:MAG: hypothetical protein KC593_07765 [Myxococcales bacterium]|nr:hypothetical protein [Myxococcales bacterium]